MFILQIAILDQESGHHLILQALLYLMIVASRVRQRRVLVGWEERRGLKGVRSTPRYTSSRLLYSGHYDGSFKVETQAASLANDPNSIL